MAINIGTKTTAKAAKSKLIDVTLMGHKYKLRKPKGAVALRVIHLSKKMAGAGSSEADMLAMDDLLSELVLRIFGAEYQPGVLERLYDPNDDLDVVHIGSLIEALLSEEDGGEGNPTG